MHQRIIDYEAARARIFKEELKKGSRRYKKIAKLRSRDVRIRKIKKKIVETVVMTENDNRFYAKTTVGNKDVLALLDSGAGVCCLGRNCFEFLKGMEKDVLKLRNQTIKTANGGRATVFGIITLPVKWNGITKDLEFLIIPDLEQEIYLGVDFWKIFNLSVVGNVSPKITSHNFPVSEIVESEELSFIASKLHELTPDQTRRLEAVKSVFPSFAKRGLGKTTLEQHTIQVTDEDTPIKQRHYPVSPAIQKLLYDELDRMLDLGVIEVSNSSWSSPVTLVRKGDKNRLCLDARKLNIRTIKDAYPLPHIDGILSRLQDTRFISAIDLKDAFWQIPLEEKSREKTAFTVPGRPLYQYTVMPFGLCNAAQRMCRLMDKVIPAIMRSNVFVYLDDLLVCSASFDDHLILLEDVARCLTRANLTINVEKSKFCYREVRYLGFVVGDGSIKTDEEKVKAVAEFPVPKTPRQLRRFLGMTGWYRRFVKNYASVASSLHDCLSKERIKKFTLSSEAQHAFDCLKQCLISAPVLVNPDFTKRFYIQCDASSQGVGGVLFQIDNEGNEHPIAYMSAKLNKAQRNYSVTELECYAAVLSVKKFRAYVEGLPFTIITDHASLRWLMSQKELSGRLARWSLKLQSFNFDIQHRKGSENVVPDALSRAHMEEICKLGREIEVNLDSPAFSSKEYQALQESVLGAQQEQKIPDIRVSEGYVYKRTSFYRGDPIQEDRAWKLWVPTELRQELVWLAHHSVSAGHGGVQKTLGRLQTKYYWPKMAADVPAIVRSCDICSENKSTNKFCKPPMGKQFITERPFQRIYIDFMGPYPRSKSGNSFLFVCLDHFTKYVFLEPMSAATSIKVVSFLEKRVFHTFGVPEFVHSDNGRQFISEAFQEFMRKYGATHIRTAFYSPQANASERVNRSVLQVIRSFIAGQQKQWDEHITDVEFALRSAYHSAIQIEPYYALFGCHMVQHASAYRILRKIDKVKDVDFLIDNLPNKQQLIRDFIFKNLSKAHEKGERIYNTRCKNINFFKGQVVYRRNNRQSSQADGYNAKPGPRHIKCIIGECKGNSLYELLGLDGKKIGIYHARDIFAA